MLHAPGLGLTINSPYTGDFSDIQAGMSEIRTKSDHPQAPLDVSNAATTDVPARLPILTLSANSGPTLTVDERQFHPTAVIETSFA